MCWSKASLMTVLTLLPTPSSLQTLKTKVFLVTARRLPCNIAWVNETQDSCQRPVATTCEKERGPLHLSYSFCLKWECAGWSCHSHFVIERSKEHKTTEKKKSLSVLNIYLPEPKQAACSLSVSEKTFCLFSFLFLHSVLDSTPICFRICKIILNASPRVS